MIGACGVDPEFEHAARAVKGAGHPSFPLKLAGVAKVDKHNVVASMQSDGLLDRQRLYLALGGIQQRPKPGRDCLRHEAFRMHRYGAD